MQPATSAKKRRAALKDTRNKKFDEVNTHREIRTFPKAETNGKMDARKDGGKGEEDQESQAR